MGLSLVYTPELFRIPEGKAVKKIAAGKDSFVVVTSNYFSNIKVWIFIIKADNQVYMKNEFFKIRDYNIKVGVNIADNSIFGNAEILDIGGSYENKYLIVKH